MTYCSGLMILLITLAMAGPTFAQSDPVADMLADQARQRQAADDARQQADEQARQQQEAADQAQQQQEAADQARQQADAADQARQDADAARRDAEQAQQEQDRADYAKQQQDQEDQARIQQLENSGMTPEQATEQVKGPPPPSIDASARPMPSDMQQALTRISQQQIALLQEQQQLLQYKMQHPNPTAAQTQALKTASDRHQQDEKVFAQSQATFDQILAHAGTPGQQFVSRTPTGIMTARVAAAPLPSPAPPRPSPGPAPMTMMPTIKITPVEDSPDYQAALKTMTDAKNAADDLKQKLLAPVHATDEYKQALAVLVAAKANLARAKAASPDQVPSLATLVLQDEQQVTNIEQRTLGASPDWKTANAQLQADINSLAAVRTALAQSELQRSQQEQADREQE